MRQVQKRVMKSIYRSEFRSPESMDRRGHGCNRSGNTNSYDTLLAGTGRDDTGLLEQSHKACGRRPPMKLISAGKAISTHEQT